MAENLTTWDDVLSQPSPQGVDVLPPRRAGSAKPAGNTVGWDNLLSEAPAASPQLARMMPAPAAPATSSSLWERMKQSVGLGAREEAQPKLGIQPSPNPQSLTHAGLPVHLGRVAAQAEANQNLGEAGARASKGIGWKEHNKLFIRGEEFNL